MGIRMVFAPVLFHWEGKRRSTLTHCQESVSGSVFREKGLSIQYIIKMKL